MSKKHSKRKSKLAALGLAVLMLGSAIPAYAQTETVEEQEIVVNLNESEPTNPLDEYTEQLTPSEIEQDILYDNGSLIAPLATVKTIAWPIPANTSMISAGFQASSGGIIKIRIYSAAGYTIDAGILQPNNVYRYAKLTDGESYSFSLTLDGTYYIRIRNTNDVRITVTGAYSY